MASAIVTASVTAFFGVVVLVLGQIFVTLFLKRIELQARTVEEIAEALVMYARDYTGPINLPEVDEEHRETVRQKLLEIQTVFRRPAARLRASAQTLWLYRVFETVKLVLPKADVIEASKELIGLSNSVPPDVRQGFDGIQVAMDSAKNVRRLLRIQT
ncbi:MAG: hypothetical protein AAB303_05180 [Chloroflexota bacterium]